MRQPIHIPTLSALGGGKALNIVQTKYRLMMMMTRICPGRYLGDNNLFLLVTGLMSAVDISPEKDPQGNDILPNPVFTAGLIR